MESFQEDESFPEEHNNGSIFKRQFGQFEAKFTDTIVNCDEPNSKLSY